MTFRALLIIASVVLCGAVPSLAQTSRAPAFAQAYFINLADGDVVTSPVLIRFGLSGMGIAPAGLQGEATAKTGHHHLLINAELKGDDLKNPIPADEQHIHFGSGQTEARVSLPKGRHTLQLVLGDWTHVPHDKPVMSERITITVR